ncbi:hypothetical protein RhiirA1_478043 [Rhizophagus irregularis]|uniref:Uncharacterized protein n=1 Tax=Rhizophagus irregularis TaxID=588596 RepID=A0A2N0QSM4_9GLOM|nr:hypothetical protein RhiirA1_478043 [Rhizophagus irregularis]
MTLELELLKQCISELKAKNAKLKAEKAEFLKQIMEKNAKYNAENTELKFRVRKLEVKLAILEQDNLVSAVDISDFMVDQQNNADIQLLKEILKVSDKKIDELISKKPANLLISVINQLKQCRPNGKVNNVVLEKKVDNEIREKKREKKLQNDSLLEVVVYKVNLNSGTVVTFLDSVKQKVEQDLRYKLPAYMKSKGFTLQSENKTFDIQISEVFLGTILIEFTYEDQVRDIKSVNNIKVYNEIKVLLPNITDVNLRIGIDKIQVNVSKAVQLRWFDKDMFFNEANPSKVNTVTSVDDMYFDEINDANTHDGNFNSCNNISDPNSNSGDEMPDDSDDDGYNGYSGYNECGECDRGYYYRDRRYERRGSSMMSPIISPVTA